MPILTRRGVRSSNFDNLEIGELNLRVPLQDDIIQIDARGPTEAGRLIIDKALCTATVRMEDDSPLQVELVDLKANGRDFVKRQAFAAPIPALEIHRANKSWRPALWLPSDEIEIADPRAFGAFIDRIGAFGCVKQNRSARLEL